MNFEEYMAGVEAKNSALFAAKKIQMTPASLREQMRRAFEAGTTSPRPPPPKVEREKLPPLFRELFPGLR